MIKIKKIIEFDIVVEDDEVKCHRQCLHHDGCDVSGVSYCVRWQKWLEDHRRCWQCMGAKEVSRETVAEMA